MKKINILALLIIILFASCSKQTDPTETKIKKLILDEKYTQAIEEIKLNEENEIYSDKYIYYKALALNKLTKNTEALNVCNEALSIDSNNALYYDLRATILSDTGDLYSALSSINIAISKDDKAMYLNNKSYILNKLEKYSAAKESANEAIKSDSNYDMAFVNLGYSKFYLNDSNGAIEEYNKAISINPQNDIAFYNKACHLLTMGNTENALLSINSAINLDSDNLEYLNKKSEIQMKTKNYKEAKKTLTTAQNINNRYEKTYINLSLLSIYKNDFEKASEYIDYFETINGNINSITPLKAKLLSIKGNKNKALKLCTNSLSLNHNNSDLYNIIGEIYLDDYKYDDAMIYFEKSISSNTMNINAYLNKASLLFDKNNYNNCIRFSIDTLELFPYSFDLYSLIASSYSNLSKHEESINIYNKMLKKNYNNKSIYLKLAKEYSYINNLEKAISYSKKSLTIDPNYESALKLNAELTKINTSGNSLYKFVSDNYLYNDKTSNINSIKETNLVSNKQLNQYIENIKYRNDIFTYFVENTNYKMLKKYNEIETIKIDKINDKLYYLKLESFNFSTGVKVIEKLDSLDFTKDKNIILDLRNNKSALLSPVYNILDYLTPSCTLNYEISKNGTITPVKSNEYSVKFNKIFIIVDKTSYSGAELLTASLKNNLNNVVIIGNPTPGYHIGQLVYENSNNEYYIYLSSIYWSLNKQQTDLEDKIYPDIELITSNKSIYINHILKYID